MVAPIRLTGSRTALGTGAAIQIGFNPRDIARVRKRLEQNMGAPLHKRLEVATMKAADLMRGPIAAAAPRGPTGNLRRSVKARKNTTGTGWLVGPTANHSHLVISGTKPHSLERVRPGKSDYISFRGKGTHPGVRYAAGVFHPGARANPFVDRVANRLLPRAVALVQEKAFV